MLLVPFRPQSTTAFRLVVHSADIVWPVLISMFATAQRGPFFLFFVFVMAAAAYRWGLWETVGTAGAGGGGVLGARLSGCVAAGYRGRHAVLAVLTPRSLGVGGEE